MNRQEIEKICDAYSTVISTVIEMVSKYLMEEHGIILMSVGRILYFSESQPDARVFDYALGEPEILMKAIDHLKEEFRKEFEKIEKQQFKNDIKKAFEILEREKKPFLN